jgi:hypothetical protein
MPAKKIRVEVFDGGGNRYTITFEGQVTRDKALRLLDIVELLGGMPGVNTRGNQTISELSKLDRLRFIVEKNFPMVWFSSKDAQKLYEKELKEPIKLSTISTYLSRMVNRGILTSNNTSKKIQYRMVTQIIQDALKFAKNNE